MMGGVALGLFARLPGWLRDRLIKKRYSVANRLQAAGPVGRLMQSPKGGSDGSVQSFVVHVPNVGAARYGSIPVLDLFIRQKAASRSTARADQLLDEGDMAGCETWHRILNAIERLQAKAPAEGEKVH
jgi:hypothetical protein